jgi:hypothetical protein
MSATMEFKPSDEAAAKLAAVNNRTPKGKDPLKSDTTPDEVVNHFVSKVLSGAGSGVDVTENPVDQFINIIDRLWGNDGSDGSDVVEPEEVTRCISTNFLYNTPKNFKGPRKIRTNIPLWIIKSIVRTDVEDFEGFCWSDVVSSRKFTKTLNDLTRALGAHPVKVFGADSVGDGTGNAVDLTRFRDGDLEGVFASGETPDGNEILVFEFKRRIPQKEIDVWAKGNLTDKPKRKSNKEKYNKNLREGSGETPRTNECFAFQRNECERGTSCRFSHDGTGLGPQKRAQKRDPRPKNPCFAFQKGECTYEDKCRFSHEVQTPVVPQALPTANDFPALPTVEKVPEKVPVTEDDVPVVDDVVDDVVDEAPVVVVDEPVDEPVVEE